MLALIHSTFNINIVKTTLGLTLFLSGFLLDIFLYLDNQNKLNRRVKLVKIRQTIPTSNHQIIFDTKGGGLEQNIARDFIGRDAINNSTKNITIRDRKVEVNPNNIIKTFDEFRDILVQSINQSSEASAAISEFAKELTEQLRNQPEVKSCFDVDKNISLQELIKEIFIDLLTNNYNQIEKEYSNNLIVKPATVETINISNSSQFIEYFRDCGNNEYDVIYQNYIIHLFQDELKRWRYKIKRSDSSFLERENRTRARNIYLAIGKAIIEIERELTNNWTEK
ncbi:MAG: hypothetical protein RMZ43_014075 [Nostoc sp. CmiVER01]|uniref:hypothetical protein n=1 Tax=Nostoc sp. CmiVER01 TaxID=3075384 RepID=UPI002AD437B4|nr:hypothetical protein [Nostoc sp. CmiVER01]MDZ8124840.1 hypothetical protein [Nostoc sp. CmiVER01]